MSPCYTWGGRMGTLRAGTTTALFPTSSELCVIWRCMYVCIFQWMGFYFNSIPPSFILTPPFSPAASASLHLWRQKNDFVAFYVCVSQLQRCPQSLSAGACIASRGENVCFEWIPNKAPAPHHQHHYHSVCAVFTYFPTLFDHTEPCKNVDRSHRVVPVSIMDKSQRNNDQLFQTLIQNIFIFYIYCWLI